MKNYTTFIILFLSGLVNGQNDITIMDLTGQAMFSYNCEFMGSMSDGFALIEEVNISREFDGSRWGIVDLKSKKITVPPTKDYAEIGWVEKGQAVVIHNKGWDENFKKVLNPDEQLVSHPYVGVIDARTGAVTIPFEYTGISFLRDNLRIAIHQSGFCVFDEKGNKLVCKEGKYPHISQGMIYYSNGEMWDKKKAGMIHRDGTDFIPYDNEYDDFSGEFHYGLMPIKKNGKFGYVNDQLEVVIPYQFDFAGKFDMGLSIVLNDGKYGIINISGDKVVAESYLKSKDIQLLSENCIKFKKNEHWGMYDKNGKVILSPEYVQISEFTQGFGTAENKDGRVSIINEKGEVVLPLGQGITFGKNSNGLFSFEIDNKYGIMNFNGDEILPPIHDRVKLMRGDHWIISKDNQQGLLSSEGQVILPVEYDRIQQQYTEQEDLSFLLQKGNLYGLLYQGRLLKPQYKRVGLGAAGYINVYN